MKIAFVRNGHAYLPEIQAYQTIFKEKGIKSKVCKSKSELTDEDIIWQFCGLDTYHPPKNKKVIHEYASLSTPPFALQKNKLKRLFNSKPNLRIFNSDYIRNQLNFNDNTPYIIRPAGISNSFFEINKSPVPEYEFVYLGATDQSRQINILFSKFLENFPTEKLLIIGTPPKDFKTNERIKVTGSIPYHQVSLWLAKAKFGINFIPDIYPYNRQASLKLLEYCAVGLPIITTGYHWLNEFEAEREAHFFKLTDKLLNFKPSEIKDFPFSTPSVHDLTWEKIIESSGILYHPIFSSM